MLGRQTERSRSRSASFRLAAAGRLKPRRDRPMSRQARRWETPSSISCRAPNRRLGAPTIFLNHLLHRPVLEHLLGEQSLELAVLALEIPKLANVIGLHAGVLLAPSVKRELAYAVRLADLANRLARLNLGEDANNLLLAVITSLHA